MTKLHMATSQNDPRNGKILQIAKLKGLRPHFTKWVNGILIEQGFVDSDGTAKGGLGHAVRGPLVGDDRVEEFYDRVINGLEAVEPLAPGDPLPEGHPFAIPLAELMAGEKETPVDRTSTIEKYTADSEEVEAHSKNDGEVRGVDSKVDPLDAAPPCPELACQVDEQVGDPNPLAHVTADELDGFREFMTGAKDTAKEALKEVVVLGESNMLMEGRLSALEQQNSAQRLDKVEDILGNCSNPCQGDPDETPAQTLNVIEARLSQAEVSLQDLGDSLPGGASNRDGADIAAITASITHAVLDEVVKLCVTRNDLQVLLNLNKEGK